MARQPKLDSLKRKHRPGASHERWLLSYSDMITLLLALFVVMFAASSVNNAKLRVIAESVATALGVPRVEDKPGDVDDAQSPAAGTLKSKQYAVLTPSAEAAKKLRGLLAAHRREERELARLARRIRARAQKAGFGSSVRARVEERGLAVRLVSDRVLFDLGKADLRPEAIPLLRLIAQELRRVPNHIRVEGHTDTVPINTPMFASNWELSAVRATTVVRYLDRQRIASRRLSAAGYGHRRPIASNATARGRQRNRRVEVVVLRRYPLSGDLAAAQP